MFGALFPEKTRCLALYDMEGIKVIGVHKRFSSEDTLILCIMDASTNNTYPGINMKLSPILLISFIGYVLSALLIVQLAKHSNIMCYVDDTSSIEWCFTLHSMFGSALPFITVAVTIIVVSFIHCRIKCG